MTEREVRDYLQDILNTIESSEHFIEGMDFEQFISDEKTIFAVSRALEILGEAAKHIPEDLRKKYHTPLEKNGRNHGRGDTCLFRGRSECCLEHSKKKAA